MKSSSPDFKGAYRTTDKGVEIRVFVLPRSSQSKIVGIHDGALKIKITRPPVDGAANAECCRVIAKHLGIPKSQVQLIRGAASRSKILLVNGISESEMRGKLPGSICHSV